MTTISEFLEYYNHNSLAYISKLMRYDVFIIDELSVFHQSLVCMEQT